MKSAAEGRPPTRACGLQPLPPGESGPAGTASALVALSIDQSTVRGRSDLARTMETTIANRLYLPSGVPDALPATTEARRDANLYLVRPLGSGIYGTVCAAGFRQTPGVVTTPLPLAVKIADGDGPTVQATLREVAVTQLLSALVTRRACPNLPCMYGAAVRYPDEGSRGSAHGVDLFQEVAECDLTAWAVGPRRSETEWMSVMFQVCAGLAWAGRVYDVTNNDLYGRNILLSRIISPTSAREAVALGGGRAVSSCARDDLPCAPDPVFRYAIESRDGGWRDFVVRTRCRLARPIDFALSSSDRLRAMGVDVPAHGAVAASVGGDASPEGAPQRPSVASLASLIGERHVIFHPYLNAYARDIAVLLATAASESNAPTAVRRWAVAGLHRLYAEIASRTPSRPAMSALARARGPSRTRLPALARALATMRSTTGPPNRAFLRSDDLIDFVTGVLFDPAFMARAGLPADLFAHDAASAGAQVFTLPILDNPVPPEPPVPYAMMPEDVASLAEAFGVS